MQCISLSKSLVVLALYLSGTYCHKTSTRPPNCVTPRQPTIYVTKFPYETKIKLHPKGIGEILLIDNM